ncbi:VOC family protein [Pseudorhodobacter wandonensis]|jgi:predicted enzyme related to lactoylglutathione lyase|uniref:VOC family protein n=1 Tax=Pseudorhodobacter wandonensis TaxID=1120568 RepID=UPI00067B3DE1|nr:VOC family protein [Pseudorhodobacter wandonensis]
MTVLRIVANLAVYKPQEVAAFYTQLLGLEVAMDLGFITTLTGTGRQTVQVSFASEGGSGTEVPTFSIEVDDLDAVLAKAEALGATPIYGPVTEPWGVRRFYLRDPVGTVINILCHE